MSSRLRSDRSWYTFAALAAIVLLAAFLRLYRLAEVPPALFFDEAGQGVDSLGILAGRRPIFFQRSITKEPLYVYWTVPFVALIERGPWAVRLPAALIGIATVPVVFMLARELLIDEGRRWATAVALLAAGLLAGSFWAVLVNRLAFRVNLVPLMTALAFALIWRTFRLGGVRLAITAGAALGLCFYTYLSARFIYPMAVLIVALLALTAAGRTLLHARRRELIWMAVVCVAVMLPLGSYFIAHPEDFLRRAAMVTAGGEEERPYAAQLAAGILGQFGMFGGPGDPAIRHNLPGRSILTPWLAGLFWLGVGLALLRIRRPGRMVALVWLLVMLLPAILSVSDPRHMLRAFSVLPVVYLFPALALGDAWTWLAARTPATRRPWIDRAALTLAAALILVEALITGRAYFDRWANLPDLPRAFRAMDTAIAEEINAAPASVGYIVPLAPLWRGLGGNYTLDYLIERPDSVLMLYPDAPDAAAQLRAFLARPEFDEVRIVRYTWAQDAAADPRRLVPLLVELAAAPRANREETDYVVDAYTLHATHAGHVAAPPFEPTQASFVAADGATLALSGVQPLRHHGVQAGHLPSGGRGAVGLEWRWERPPATELRVSLRLLDALGKPVGQADSLLVDGGGQTPVDDALVTYHPVMAAPGTPPGSYALELIVYEPAADRRLPLNRAGAPRDAAPIGRLAVGAPLDQAVAYAPSFAAEEPVALTPDLSLLGVEIAAESVAPGMPVDLTLAWAQHNGERPTALRFRLGDTVVGRETLALSAGGPWRTTHRILIPEQLPPDAYRLTLDAGGEAAAELTTLTVAAGPSPESEARSVRFAGGLQLVDHAVELAAPDARITLWWRQDGSDAPLPNYTVFVHLFDKKRRLIAQRDTEPVDGRYPTSVWPPDRVVVDQHDVSLPPDVEMKTLCALVGLYLPGSGQRLITLTGDDAVNLTPGCVALN